MQCPPSHLKRNLDNLPLSALMESLLPMPQMIFLMSWISSQLWILYLLQLVESTAARASILCQLLKKSSDEESKSFSSDSEAGSDEESDEDIAMVEMPSKLITPPSTGKKWRHRRESKKCELYVILLLYYF